MKEHSIVVCIDRRSDLKKVLVDEQQRYYLKVEHLVTVHFVSWLREQINLLDLSVYKLDYERQHVHAIVVNFPTVKADHVAGKKRGNV